jgi:transposase
MVSDGRAGRRKWTSEQKQRIVDETRAPGASVSVVARRYDLNANLLFKWKRQEEAGGLAVPAAEAPEFVPIGVVGRANDGGAARQVPDAEPRNQGSGWPEGEVRRPSGLEWRTGVIEIDLPEGARVRVDAFVDARALARVLSAEAARTIQVAPGTKVHLACRPVSMRSGFDGLSAKVARCSPWIRTRATCFSSAANGATV